MSDGENALTKLVNGSGFPLQIGVEHIINSYFTDKQWQPLLREHPWKNQSAGTSGFIDLVVEGDSSRNKKLVIECKRVRDTEWVFLVPKSDWKPRSIFRCWTTDLDESGRLGSYSGWNNVSTPPATPLSEFCVVQGHDSKSRPMLERVAADLVDATEAIAKEEIEHHFGQSLSCCYFPVIVTTANLKVCSFESNDVDIKTGEIVNPTYTSVPAVRFHKTLSIPQSPSDSVADFMDKVFSSTKELTEIHRDAVRTVLVINAHHLIEYLQNW